MEEDERASHEEMENYISPLAPLRKGIFVEKGDSE